MIGRFRIAGGVVVAWAGAMLWAYGLAVLEPLTEDGSKWYDGSTGNNMYWPREIRWAAMLAGIAGLIVVADGVRRRTALVGAGAVAWLAADLLGDRADLSALIPVTLTAVVAVTVVAAAAVLLRAPSDPAPGDPAAGNQAPGNPAAARRWPLTSVMVMCAGALPAAAIISSPTDLEPQLAPSRLAAIALLAVTTVVTALAAWGQRPENVVPVCQSGPTHRGWGATWADPRRGQIGRSVAAVLLVAGIVAGFGTHPGFGYLTWLLGSAALAGSWLLSRRWVSWTTALAGIAGTLIAFPFVAVILFFLCLQVGAPFTALAGDPAINSADEDTLLVLVGMLTGLPFTAAPPLLRRVPGYRPVTGPVPDWTTGPHPGNA